MRRWCSLAAALLLVAGVTWGCSSSEVELEAPQSEEEAQQQQQFEEQMMMAPPDYQQRAQPAEGSAQQP